MTRYYQISYHVIFKIAIPGFGGKDFGKWFWGTGNISDAPKHNLLCSFEHKNKIGKTGEIYRNFKCAKNHLILDDWLHMTNRSITQPIIHPHDNPISLSAILAFIKSVSRKHLLREQRQTKADGRIRRSVKLRTTPKARIFEKAGKAETTQRE